MHRSFGDVDYWADRPLEQLSVMLECGYRGITCVDFSRPVLDHWRKRSNTDGRSSLRFEQADIVEGLHYEHYSYNVVIDKGTVDCILCRDSGEVDACKALQNVYNELKHPGAFVMFSHSPPVIRLGLLQSCAWDDVQVKVLVPADLEKSAKSNSSIILREYSEGMPLSDLASYLYIAKRSY
eukprot:jgi/Chrzof1/15046/Cz09g25050.t1